MKLYGEIAVAKQIKAALHLRREKKSLDLSKLSLVFSELSNPAILNSGGGGYSNSRYSYFAARAVDVFEFRRSQTNLRQQLDTIFSKYKFAGSQEEVPKNMFTGGWIGYFAYELKDYFEKLPNTHSDFLDLPLIHLCFYDSFVCWDSELEELIYCAIELDGDDWQSKLDFLEELVAKSETIADIELKEADIDSVVIDDVKSNMSRSYFEKSIESTKRYIKNGDVYQINFSQCFEMDFRAKAIELFLWQNKYNPSPYSAFLSFDETAVVCASPELFLEINGLDIKTSPIKGTVKKVMQSGSEAKRVNDAHKKALLECEKEKAELNMITDLLRNDLARVSQSGSRWVSEPRHIAEFATLYHTIATVSARLRSSVDFYELLKSTFPGGSITGAPKIRAMEIIDELEPNSRGIYTGSIGWIGVDGSVCLNIAIRNVIIHRETAFIQTGGGIVDDSTAANEWLETITKARSQLAAIKAVSSI